MAIQNTTIYTLIQNIAQLLLLLHPCWTRLQNSFRRVSLNWKSEYILKINLIRWELITNSKTHLLKHFQRASKFCQRVWWCTWFEAKCSRVVFIKCSCDTFSCLSITPFVSCTFEWSARRYEFTIIDYFRAKLVIMSLYSRV